MSKSLRVLIVEDSIADAELLLHDLRQGGYEPTYRIVDTREAMNEALEQQEWDIVLADYVIPSFGGLAALDLLKVKGIDLPFLIVSGAIGEDMAVAAMKAGAHDYIMKGNLARLLPAVEREMREAEVRRERRKAEAERDRLMVQLRNVNEQMVLSSLRIQEQAAETEAIVAALAEAVLVYGPGGEIIRVNPAAADLLGFSSNEQGKSITRLLALLRIETEDGEPFPLENTPPVRALRGETVRGVTGVVHRVSDGKSFCVSISAAPIRTPEGELRGGVTIFTEIGNSLGREGVTGPKA